MTAHFSKAQLSLIVGFHLRCFVILMLWAFLSICFFFFKWNCTIRLSRWFCSHFSCQMYTPTFSNACWIINVYAWCFFFYSTLLKVMRSSSRIPKFSWVKSHVPASHWFFWPHYVRLFENRHSNSIQLSSIQYIFIDSRAGSCKQQLTARVNRWMCYKENKNTAFHKIKTYQRLPREGHEKSADLHRSAFFLCV